MKNDKSIPKPSDPSVQGKDKAINNNHQSPKFFNRDALIFSAIATVFFLIVRSIFPIPDLITDSRGYILGAITDADIGYRPMGICVFLQKVYAISPDIAAVAIAQYIILMASLLALAHSFTLCYKFSPLGRKILYGVLLVNPALIYLCNSVYADSLFISLNIAWLALLIYLFKKPNYLFLAGLLGILYMSMFIRYNALAYPLIIIVTLLFLPHKVMKWVGIAGCIGAALLFHSIIVNRMEDATTFRVFSGFSGWQLASNAMTAYKAGPHKGINTSDPNIRDLDAASIKYIDSMLKTDPNYRTDFVPDFIWHANAPFIIYQDKVRANSGGKLNAFQSWVAASLTLGDYGKAVILQDPFGFIVHFILPNTIAFLHPELENSAKYSTPEVMLFPQIVDWYNIPAQTKSNYKTLPATINTPVQWFYTILSIAFIVCIVAFVVNKKKWNLPKDAKNAILIVFIFWIGKMGFDVIAAPVYFRYVAILVPLLAGPVLIAYESFRAYKTQENLPVETKL